jgi:hypothetical protein
MSHCGEPWEWMFRMQEDRREKELERRLAAWAHSQPNDFRPGSERRLHDALAGSLAPVRPLPAPRTLALGFFAVFAILGALLIAVLKLARVHFMADSQSAWMIAIFAGAGFLFCRDIAQRMIPGSRLVFPRVPVLALCGFAAIGGLALLFPWSEPGTSAADGWRCAALESAIAVPATSLFWLLARRGVLFASPGLGAALAGAGVFLALVPVQLQCMFPRAPHLLIWHDGTAAIIIGTGALVTRLLVRPLEPSRPSS